MTKLKQTILLILIGSVITVGCTDDEKGIYIDTPALDAMFSGTIDVYNLEDYTNQIIPAYITKDNTSNNPITNEGATLGRVLFYDKNLSVDGTISCSSCHQQQNAFADPSQLSLGVNGETGRHAMRLVNVRFADETKFFWDERAISLEQQTTQPIQNHAEMGFSGQDGNPDIEDLVSKLAALEYYQELFTIVYGDSEITELRIQLALAQFIRSIQSFDSKFDLGRAMVANQNQDFPNYTVEENLGKRLFLDPPPLGGAGCGGCHRAPEFDIDPNTQNNGVISVAILPDEIDLNNTRAPSLRDLFNVEGELNGVLMHNGQFNTLEEVIEHYNSIEVDPLNPQLDMRLRAGGNGQQLRLSPEDQNAIVAFVKTLSGNNIYTDKKWSGPFQ